MFGPKLINDRDAGDTTEDASDYSSIPKWHGILTVAVLILTVAGMVLTDYLDFLPPMHVTACCGAIVIVLCGVLSQKEAFALFEMLTVFMLAFMMPLGTALNDTGAGKMIAESLGADPRAVVIAVFVASSVAVCTPMAIPANSMILNRGQYFLIIRLSVCLHAKRIIFYKTQITCELY